MAPRGPLAAPREPLEGPKGFQRGPKRAQANTICPRSTQSTMRLPHRNKPRGNAWSTHVSDQADPELRVDGCPILDSVVLHFPIM
eukprot:499464-Pyramimonas_sp.AAC.1